MVNALYYGDNLEVLRDQIPDEWVNLVYLDPPFNSNANYNVLFKGKTGEESPAQIRTIGDLLNGNDFDMPRQRPGMFREAELVQREKGGQAGLWEG